MAILKRFGVKGINTNPNNNVSSNTKRSDAGDNARSNGNRLSSLGISSLGKRVLKRCPGILGFLTCVGGNQQSTRTSDIQQPDTQQFDRQQSDTQQKAPRLKSLKSEEGTGFEITGRNKPIELLGPQRHFLGRRTYEKQPKTLETSEALTEQSGPKEALKEKLREELNKILKFEPGKLKSIEDVQEAIGKANRACARLANKYQHPAHAVALKEIKLELIGTWNE